MPPKTAASPTTPRPRSRPLVVLDLVTGILLALVGGVFALAGPFLLPFTAEFRWAGILLVVLSTVAWLVGAVMLVVFAVRRRVSFYWSIIGIALVFGSWYLVLAIAASAAA